MSRSYGNLEYLGHIRASPNKQRTLTYHRNRKTQIQALRPVLIINPSDSHTEPTCSYCEHNFTEFGHLAFFLINRTLERVRQKESVFRYRQAHSRSKNQEKKILKGKTKFKSISRTGPFCQITESYKHYPLKASLR